MGWTVFNGMPRGGMQKAIDDSINGSGICRVVESVLQGGEYYAAVRAANGDVFAAVGVVEGTGYKLMEESMNPYYYNCPARILDMLTPASQAWPGQLADSTIAEWSTKWRERCRERLAMGAAS